VDIEGDEFMRFSTAKESITPDWSTLMGGYGARKLRSTGVRDEIYARALMLDDNKNKVLIVSLEIVFVMRDFVSKIKKMIGEQYGLKEENILISSIHTHSGPSTYSYARAPYLHPEPPEEKFMMFLEEKIIKCVKDCLSASHEGQMEIGKGETYIAMNRRQKTDYGIELAPNPEGFVDRDLFATVVKDMEGNIKAVMYSCACHPTVLDHDNLFITGDFVSPACREIEKRYPGATAMFMQGACGDNNPATKAGDAEYRQTYFSDIEFTGKVLANDVYNVVRCGMEKVDLSIKASLENIKLPLGESKVHILQDRMSKDKSAHERYKSYVETILKRLQDGYFNGGIGFQVGIMELSSKVRVIALEGEICQGIGTNIKNLYGSGFTIISGYSNGVVSYIPTRDIIREGGYEDYAAYMNYGLPGSFDESVEETITQNIRERMEKDRLLKSNQI
jgi:neutral ceramidase